MNRWISAAARLGALVATALLAGLPLAAHAGERAWSATVADQFRAAGLAPALGRSYLQPLKLKQQTIALDRSSVSFGDVAVSLGQDLGLDTTARQPERMSAQLYFVGSREPGPAMLHELQGKVVVMLAADAAALEPAAWLALEHSGALGFLTIGAPAAPQAAAFLTEDAPVRLVATVAPTAATALFARSGRDYDQIAALSLAGRGLPSFALNQTVSATLAVQTRTVASANVVGVAAGSDPMLAREYVVVSAEAGAAASVLDAAQRFRQAGMAPKRSMLFAVFAPEGAAAAQAFAAHPPVAREAIVASLSAATAPSADLASLTIEGAQETSLGSAAHALALNARLAVGAQGASARSGAGPYGLLEAGVPALRLTFGAAARSDYMLALALEIADNDAHPVWMRGSRFAPRMPRAQELITAPVEMPLGRRPQRNLGDYALLKNSPLIPAEAGM